MNFLLQIELLDHDSENSLFKILPRYKVKSLGDDVCSYLACCEQILNVFTKVRLEDHVTFESDKAEGLYIHTSGKTYHQVGITLLENT